MSGALDRKLAASPRRHVRYTYLIDEWPEAKDLDHRQAMLDAPEAAVINAIVRDRERYAELLHEERRRRAHAEAELERLQEAVALVLGVAARLSAPIIRDAGEPVPALFDAGNMGTRATAP